ncbi:hypothetical protein [Schleiferilactobacillus shenzhenensis]|nr:hypothetical protein [Schleiferilactobacillus shenzhenensis]
MPTKEQKAVGRMLAAKLLDDHVSGDDPEWQEARALMGAASDDKPKTKKKPKPRVYHQLGRPMNTPEKLREREWRQKCYPEMIERGLRNADMALELGVSRSVISFDLQRMELSAHQRMHWRVTNMNTGEVSYYPSISEMHAKTPIRGTILTDTEPITRGPWLITYGDWFQDSKGNWREAPEDD